MFIVSKELMRAVLVESYSFYSEHSRENLKKAEEIHKNRMNYAYNIGSTKKAKLLADEDVDRYLSGKPKEWLLYINGDLFCKVIKHKELNEIMSENLHLSHSIDIDFYRTK